MQEILLVGIVVLTSLILQIFFLRIAHDKFDLKKDNPQFQKMVRLIYVNLGIYLILIGLLVLTLLKR